MSRCVTRDLSLYVCVCACVYIYMYYIYIYLYINIHTYMHIYMSLPFFRDLVLLLCFLRIYYVCFSLIRISFFAGGSMFCFGPVLRQL